METTKRIEYHELDPFKKDLKKLSKRFRTLPDDIEVAKKNAIELFHVGKLDSKGVYQTVDSGAIFPIPGFSNDQVQICKIRKFACRSLKGRGAQSGIRIIYAWHPATLRVDFIEIYFKGDQPNEDRQRTKEYILGPY